MIHPNGLINARFNTDQFWHMGEWGFFAGRQVMLLDGDILELPKVGPYHYTAINIAIDALTECYDDGFYVRRPGPLAFSKWTDPEPDIAVVKGGCRDYEDAHPSTAFLVIEFSESSPEVDRTVKLPLYAEHGISELWILDLAERCLDVYTSPTQTADSWIYSERRTLRETERITPPNAPKDIAIADLMPSSPLCLEIATLVNSLGFQPPITLQ